MVISLQPHFDEGPEDDLEAHRELERGRRLPRQDPSPVQDVLRENEEDFRLVREHHHPLPAQRTPDRTPSPYRLTLYKSYLIYSLYNDTDSKSSEIAGSEAGAPGQDLARAGRARLGTVSAREAVVAMFANNRILLSFREDVLGRARVFPGLKLAENQMHFTSACRGASRSGEIRSGAGGAWVASLNARMSVGARRSPARTAVKASSETPC